VSDIDYYLEQVGLLHKKTQPPSAPKPEPEYRPIKMPDETIDEYLIGVGLEPSAMYKRRRGPIPEPPEPGGSLADLLASSDDPVKELNEINTTRYIAQTFKLDPAFVQANLEEVSKFWLGKVVPPPTLAKSVKNAWDTGQINDQIGKLAERWMMSPNGENPELERQINELVKIREPLTELPRPIAKGFLQNAAELLRKGIVTAAGSYPLMIKSYLMGSIMGGATGIAAGALLAVSPPGLVLAGISEGASVPAITAMMGLVGFATGSTQYLMKSMIGLAYQRMREDGVPHDIASPLAQIEGTIEGAIESLGNIAIMALFHVPIPGGQLLSDVAEKVALKLLSTGVLGHLALGLSRAVATGAAEGIEETAQGIAAIATDAYARELMKTWGYDFSGVGPGGQEILVPGAERLTFEEGVNQLWEQTTSGILGGLIFGVVGIPLGVRADVQTMNEIKGLAATTPSRLGFINTALRNNYGREVSEVNKGKWAEYLGKVWDQQHPGKAPVAAVPVTAEGAPAPAAAVVRTPEERLYTQVEERTRTREGVTAVLKAGDPTTGKRYGYVQYETVGDHIYIEDVVNETETDMRRELVLDLAARYPGQEIEWNPTDELDVALQQDLIATNPRGAEYGLQWFEAAAAPAAQQELTRGLFVQRMGELFTADTPEQAEFYGKLTDVIAKVSGQTTEEWLRKYISPEVTAITEETKEALAAGRGVAATRFMVEGRPISPLAVDLEEFKGQVKAVFTALGKADFHTGVHEFFHAVERLALSPDQIKKFETALGKLRETWTTEDIEKLADYFEDYLATGKAPTPELQTVFQQIAAALKELISFLKERLGGEVRLLSPEFEKAYDSLFAKPDSGLAQARAEAPPVAPIVTSQVEEGIEPSADNAVTIIHPSSVTPQEIELSRITLSEEVPNFKEMADKRGIIEPLLAEEYVKVGISPIVLWERFDGTLEIITGRHRLDLAQRLGLPTILSQIVREADGFTAAMAGSFDAESNIRDGQGSVRDYAAYFKNRGLTVQEASRRGLLDRHKGRSGFAIGRYAADGLYSLYRNNKISEAKASAIAAASLGDERLQGLGISKSKKLSADELGNFIALARQQVTTTEGVQSDMFGFDDTLIREGEKVAKAVSAKKAELLQERQALSSALRLSKGAQAKIVEKYGFKSGDVAAIQDRVDVLGAELVSWENWTQDPQKMREARELAGLPVAKELLHPEGEEPPGFELTPWDDKLLRPKEKATQPIFGFAEERDVGLKDWTKTPEGWQHISGKIADKQTALELTRMKDLADNLSLFHRDEAAQKEFNKAAVKIFGTTDDPELAGWILSDGKMLDFDWNKHENKPRYLGRIYHVEISQVFEKIDPKKIRYFRGAYSGAWQAGAIRIDSTHPGDMSFQSTMVPTSEQMKTIEDAAMGKRRVFLEVMAIPTGKMDYERSVRYEKLEDPDMRDIRQFYTRATATLAQRLQLFHPDLPEAPPIPQTGTYLAILTDDGSIYVDLSLGFSAHVPFIKKMGIPPGRIVSGGWVKDGVYDADVYSDTMRFVERYKAQLRISGKRPGVLLHPDDWQGNFLYGTEIDSEIYQQYVEVAKGYESAEAFRADMEEKYGEPGEADIAGEVAARFYQETWDEAHKPAIEPEVPPTVPIESPVIPGAATYDYQEKVDASRDIEDRELAAKIEAGEITEKGIDKLAGEAEAAEGTVTEKATKATEATEEALAGLTAEEQLAIKAGDELEAAMAERERVAGNEVKMLAIERRIKSFRTRLINALAGNAHVAVIMDEQGAWKRILSREAPVEEAEAYVEGITFGREIQKIIDTEKAKGVLKETKMRMYAEKWAAVEKVKEGVRKAAAQRRAAKKLREVRRKLIAHITRPPGRSIQFKGYAEQIRLIQKGLDPTMREYRIVNGVQVMEKTMKGYAREQTRKFFEENPEVAAQVPMEKLERFYSVNLPDMTLAQLEEIADSIDILRKLGRLKRHLELAQRARAAANLKNRLEGAVLRGEEPEKVIGRAKRTGKSLALWIQTLTPRRVLSLLDGVFAGVKEGPFTELGWKRVNDAWSAFKKAERERKTFVLNKMKELGFTLNPLAQLKGEEWVGRKFDIDGFLYSDGNMPTLQDVMYWYIGMKNERTAMALIEGNNLPAQVVMKGIAKLSEKERAMADAIDEDGSKNFARYRDAFIDQFNMDLPGEEHYVRMVRLKANYEMREDQAIVELTGRAGISKQFVARHSTYARIDIEAEHQKPIRTDLFNLWVEGVQEQEGFIHQYGLVREMHNIFGSDQVTAAVQQKYGSVLNHWLKKYTSDLAQADAYRAMNGIDKLARTCRKHATVAWLGFNLLSVAKQSVGAYAFMADLGPLAPAYLLEASAKLAAGSVKAVAGGHFFRNTQVDFVKERSEFVRNRQISVDLENLKHIDPGLYSAIVGKIGKWGMKGLEVMDITTVSIGWTAVYDKTMQDTQGNEARAIEAADAATIRNSPSARVQDLAEMYRHGEILKWFTMFTSELNVIWNRLTFDMPLAMRRMELYRGLSDIVSIATAGVVIAIASGALQGDDEEKKKKLILGLFQEYVESIPMFGNDIFSTISGKYFQTGGVSIFPQVQMWVNTAVQLTEGDWDMMVQKGLQALSFTVGLPHTAGRRAYKAISEENLGALLGWRKEE